MWPLAPQTVMAGLDPAISRVIFDEMPGSSPGMTTRGLA